uniref:UDP-3-O-acyl-N-acetylglucosamine deacetylase n=2 Tax=Bacteria TaxID=2 RepID=E7C4J9_9BACT|nr:UDP-3-O-acyl-N-acetylglucosamine deacetylase [uncultured Gemmatimonadales bacterium HF0200_36I24]ADI22373.1 UDP-3-O-acyl-N-acetylglucosamine deacetylase [uncultured nuHF2 cluster bacterium HF0500_02A10]
MINPKQRTLGGEKTLEGIGVHSGEFATLTMKPSGSGGIRFRRIDLEGQPEIPADLDHVVGTDLGTNLGSGDAVVLTVEHVMAALSASSIDNAIIEISGPELPIFDGSFKYYFDAILDMDPIDLNEPTKVLEIQEPLGISPCSGTTYLASPAEHLRISATIDFEHQTIGHQFGTFEITEESFKNEIAPARTFGFHCDAEELYARGLARGASLENTVVLNDQGIMNDDLRFKDEFLRHKVGDLIGDLALIGGRVQGHICSESPSHECNIALAKALKDHVWKGGS